MPAGHMPKKPEEPIKNDASGLERSDPGIYTGPQSIPVRDPDAVRASMSSHFGGVHAGRSRARETRGTHNE